MDKVTIDTARALGITDLVPQLYQDLLQPSIQEVGKGLVHVAKAVTIATAPFEATVWGYDKMRELVKATMTKKLAKVPPENIVTPALNIAGPVLTNYAFVSGIEELREMYENLLATSMSREKCALAHPAYCQVIQQLSSDEAILIKHLPAIEAKGAWVCHEMSNLDGVMLTKPVNHTFSKICHDVGLQSPEMYDSYLDNLLRLRILSKQVFSSYDDLQAPAKDRVQTNDVGIVISDFGWSFINACVEDFA